jgi:hypothetical protein
LSVGRMAGCLRNLESREILKVFFWNIFAVFVLPKCRYNLGSFLYFLELERKEES